MKTRLLPLAILCSAGLGFAAHRHVSTAAPARVSEREPMQLGAFSVSLAVKDLAASRAFYENLGFEQVGGDAAQNWLVLGNGIVKIGLFQGMFEGNILTFNPGWAQDKTPLDTFEDVREIQARLKDAGVELLVETDPEGRGVGHIVLQDPDGNQIMFDQHVPRP